MTGRKSKSRKTISSFTKDNPLCVGQLQLFVGAKIEALDSQKWYQARVVKINENAEKVFVHFDGWNSRHDKWFHYESESLRPLSPSASTSQEIGCKKEMLPGDRVLARWSDAKFYPAKIFAAVDRGNYEVIFYDGFKKVLSKCNIRPDRKRAFETYEEKFKGISSPNVPLPPDSSLASPVEDLSSPTNSRVKRRHAEPSIMADFVTSLPGKKKHRKGHIDDSGDGDSRNITFESEEQDLKESDSEVPHSRKRPVGRPKRRSSPTGSTSSASSCISGTRVSSTERETFPKGRKHAKLVSDQPAVPEVTFDEELTPKHPPVKLMRKKKDSSSFLKIKFPLKSPGKSTESRKRKSFIGQSKDDSGASGMIGDRKDLITKTNAPKTNLNLFDAKESPCTDLSDVLKSSMESKTSAELNTISDVDELGPNKDPNTQRSSEEYEHVSMETDAQSKRRKDSKLTLSEEPKRPPRRERKLTEKGLGLQQSIVHKKKTQCLTGELHDDDCLDCTRKSDLELMKDNDGQDPRPSDCEWSQKERMSSFHQLNTSVDVESGKSQISDTEEDGRDYDDRRYNIKFISERNLQPGNEKRDLEKDSEYNRSKFNTGDEDYMSVANNRSSEIEFKERAAVVGGKYAEDEGRLEVGDTDVDCNRMFIGKPVDERANVNEANTNLVDDKAASYEEQYSDAESEGSLIIDLDACSKEICNESKPVKQMAEIREQDDRTKIKPRTFPKLKYTLSNKEKKGNRIAKRKKVRGKRPRLEAEKNEVFIAKDKGKIQSNLSSHLQSLKKLVAEKADEAKPVVSVSAGVDGGEVVGMPLSVLGGTEGKASKQSKGQNKMRYKTKDNFISMVTQERPSQIERPVSEDLVHENSVKKRLKNRLTQRRRHFEMNNQGAYQGKSTESARGRHTLPVDKFMHVDVNRPLEFSHPYYWSAASDKMKEFQGNSSHSPNGSLKPNIIAEPTTSNKDNAQERLGVPPSVIAPSDTYLCEPPASVPRYPSPSGPVMEQLNQKQPHLYQGGPHMPLYPGVPSYFRPPMAVHPGSQFPARISNCLCEECRNYNHNFPVQDKAMKQFQRIEGRPHHTMQMHHAMQGKPLEKENQSIRESVEADKKIDPTFVITDVFSLRDSDDKNAKDVEEESLPLTSADSSLIENIDELGKDVEKSAASSIDSQRSAATATATASPTQQNLENLPSSSTELEEENEDSPNTEKPLSDQGSALKKGEATSSDDTMSSTPKLTSFESKKKRLDFITGKITAQKQIKFEPSEVNEEKRHSDSPASSLVGEESTSKPATPLIVAKSEAENAQGAINLNMGISPNMYHAGFYVYRGASPDGSIPVDAPMPPMYPYPDERLLPRAVMSEPNLIRPMSAENQLMYPFPHPPIHGPYLMRPPGETVPLRPAFDRDGLPTSACYGPPPPYPQMLYPLNHPRLYPVASGTSPVPHLPHCLPRHAIPPPGYFNPREPPPVPLSTSSPYDMRCPTGTNPRFIAVAPNMGMPLVICKKPDCNCPAPHAAPPVAIASKPFPTDQKDADNLKTEDEALIPVENTTSTQSVPPTQLSGQSKSQTLMKGDPRRLTLPLQRMRAMNVKDASLAKGESDDAVEHDKDGKGIDTRMRPNQGSKEPKNIPFESSNSFGTERSDDEKSGSITADEDGKENKPADVQNKAKSSSSKKINSKDSAIAPKEFVVALDLDEYKCNIQGCGKSFRKPTSLDYHTRYFHSPRVPQRKRKTSTLSSPDSFSVGLPGSEVSLPAGIHPLGTKLQKSTSVDLAHAQGSHNESLTDENVSDSERNDYNSSNDSDENELDTDDSVSVDDIIRCKCNEYEEQGFMIQCEQCLTWQHGDCVNLTVDKVPIKYICYVCSNPEGLRRSFKYKNNFDWYKRGTLPSLISTNDLNEEKIADITQASHAIMEDIFNVLDVLEGVKKKLALLNVPAHPCLRFWRQRSPQEQMDNKDKDENRSPSPKRQDVNADNMGSGDDKSNEASKEMQSNIEEKLEKDIDNGLEGINGANADCLSSKQCLDSGETPDMDKDDVSDSNDSKMNQPKLDIDNYTHESTKCEKAEDIESSDQNKEKLLEIEKHDAECAKMNLLNHVEKVEDELNDRMNEIEKTLDVLEDEYQKIKDETNDAENRSAFKLKLPDMASISKHISIINKQLLDVS